MIKHVAFWHYSNISKIKIRKRFNALHNHASPPYSQMVPSMGARLYCFTNAYSFISFFGWIIGVVAFYTFNLKFKFGLKWAGVIFHVRTMWLNLAYVFKGKIAISTVEWVARKVWCVCYLLSNRLGFEKSLKSNRKSTKIWLKLWHFFSREKKTKIVTNTLRKKVMCDCGRIALHFSTYLNLQNKNWKTI